VIFDKVIAAEDLLTDPAIVDQLAAALIASGGGRSRRPRAAWHSLKGRGS
jgi:hypothetical protein